MKPVDWNEEKNQRLKEEREVGFEDIVDAINDNRILDIIDHPNQEKHPGQKILVVEIDGYAYVVPFIEDETKYFLKSLYPSRAATKKYLVKEEKV